jgi:hypothetical protein
VVNDGHQHGGLEASTRREIGMVSMAWDSVTGPIVRDEAKILTSSVNHEKHERSGRRTGGAMLVFHFRVVGQNHP